MSVIPELLLLRAEIVGLLIVGLLFGCFSILYPVSLWMLVYKHRRHGRRSTRLGVWLFAIVTAMFLPALAHLSLVAQHVIVAFADHSAVPYGPYAYVVSGAGDAALRATCIVSAVICLIGDGFMTYRVYLVWGRSWASIILPSSLVVGQSVTIIVCSYEYNHAGIPIVEGVYADNVFPWVTSYLTLVLATNVITLVLILGRLMRYDSIVRRYCTTTPGPTVHRKVARTIVQSEAVYSAAILAQLVLYLSHSTYFLVAGYIFPPLVGISFTLIITHIGFDDIMGQLEEVDRPERGLHLEWAVKDSRKSSLPTLSSSREV